MVIINIIKSLKTNGIGIVFISLFFSLSAIAQNDITIKKYYWQSICSPGQIARAGDGETFIKVFSDGRPYKILNGNRIDLLTYDKRSGEYDIYTVDDRPLLRYWIHKGKKQIMEVLLLNPYNEDAIGVVSSWWYQPGVTTGIQE